MVSAWWLATALLAAIGLYCLMTSRNRLRVLLGVELMGKSVTLLLLQVGRLTGTLATTQAMVVTLIVVEVVVITVAIGLVVRLHGATGDVRAS